MVSIVMGIIAKIKMPLITATTHAIVALIIGVKLLPKIVIKIAMYDEVLGNQR